ncbi:MAG TPA: phospho-N-acetylmuramoyl-pentapeptide-transferase [Verrucomicrobiae bacterium]|nr:phospho-N-acetylmuramoyl-pentapeptide-transferase [Verrucomicrobiae bacterium]
MLFYLSQAILDSSEGASWAGYVSWMRLFRYITFRAAGAAVTALLLSWWLGPRVIAWLKELKFGQEYQDRAEAGGDLKARILSKKGTPTMGGIMIVLVLNLTMILWAQWNSLVELTLLTVLVLTGLGFYDDYAKIVKQHGGGAPPHVKLWVQFGVAAFVAIYLWKLPMTSELRFAEMTEVIRSNLVSTLMLPFYKYPVQLGAVGVVLGLAITVLTIVGFSNAVNLTDGLDGLAIGCTLITATVFLVLTYLASNFRYATYLQIPYVNGAGELTVFCAAILGAGMGFLWFNCHPAQVFMGDTGSLPLGGALGLIAVLIHQPFALVIAGGVFVMEAGSVVIQKGWFKYTRNRYGEGRRVFLMAPIHHHFEKKGWYESQVVMRFYILCVLFAVVALSTLKIR